MKHKVDVTEVKLIESDHKLSIFQGPENELYYRYKNDLYDRHPFSEGAQHVYTTIKELSLEEFNKKYNK